MSITFVACHALRHTVVPLRDEGWKLEEI